MGDKILIPGMGEVPLPTPGDTATAEVNERLKVIVNQLDLIIRMMCGNLKFEEMRRRLAEWEAQAQQQPPAPVD